MKNKFFGIAFLFVALVSLVACSDNNKGAQTVPDEVSPSLKDAHNAQTSLDYTGTYQGITPCADCEGIEVNLTLKADSTYTMSMKYLGKGDSAVVNKEGSYTWVDGSTIQLGGITNGPARYFVGENQVWQLDMEGKKVEGTLADKYILKKK